MNKMQMICTMCHKKNDDTKLKQLKRIEILIRKQPETKNDKSYYLANTFIQSTHEHCTYGLPCQELRRTEQRIEQIARKIEPKLITYIEKADKHELYQLLQLTQGYFPSTYREIERIWHKTH